MKWILVLILGSSLAESTFGWTYHYISDTMNWTQARRYCQSHHTDLVVIQNQAENDYLVSRLPNRTAGPYYWIGITKTHMKEPWTWVGNNSTWIGEHSWATNEPNNNHSTEFCVEIYVNTGRNRGKWNDEKCSNKKYPVCYKAQCNATLCNRGQCQETIENTTCLCEPGFMGHRCQTAEDNARGTSDAVCEAGFEGGRCQKAVECTSLSHPDNGYLSCSEGNQTLNSTCHYKCHMGFMLIGSSSVTCEPTGSWSGPRPTCTSYKHALMALAGCGAFSAFCCFCLCWMKRRKRKKLAQVRSCEEVTSPSSEAHG